MAYGLVKGGKYIHMHPILYIIKLQKLLEIKHCVHEV